MRRIDTTTRAQNLFGPGKDGFTQGDPNIALAATHVNAAWFNALQEEVAGVVEAFAPLDPGALRQLVQGIGFGFAILGAGSLEQRFTFENGGFLDAVADDTTTTVVLIRGNLADDPTKLYSAANGWDFALRTWTSVPMAAICWAPGPRLFVAVGKSGEIRTSPDAITWTKRNPQYAYAGNFTDVRASDSIIVAVGDGEFQTSVDGITWTKRTAPGASRVAWSDVAQRFLAVTSGAVAYQSADGITWTATGTAPAFDAGTVGTFGTGPAGFLAIDAVTQKVFRSANGASWTTEDAPTFQPKRVTRGGILTGFVGFNGVGLALSGARQPRIVGAHLSDSLDLVRTRASWVGGASGKVYVSKPLPF